MRLYESNSIKIGFLLEQVIISYDKLEHFLFVVPFLFISYVLGSQIHTTEKNHGQSFQFGILATIERFVFGTATIFIFVSGLFFAGIVSTFLIQALFILGLVLSLFVFIRTKPLRISDTAFFKYSWILGAVFISPIFYLLALAFFYSSLPVFEADAISNYLTIANLHLLNGVFIETGNWIGTVNKVSIVLTAVSLALHSENLAYLLNKIFGILVLFYFWCSFYREKVVSGIAAIIVVCFGFSNFFFDQYLLTIKFEGFNTLIFLIYTRYALTHLTTSNRTASSLSFAFLLGVGAAFSYNSLFLALCFFLHLMFSQNSLTSIRKFLMLCSMFFIGCWPLYLINLIQYGNPFYPVLSFIFGSGLGYDIPDFSNAAKYISIISVEHSLNGFKDIIEYVVRLLDYDYFAKGQVSRDFLFFSIILSSLVVLFSKSILFVFTSSRSENTINFTPKMFWLGLIVIASVVFWGLNQVIVRYLAPVLFISPFLVLTNFERHLKIKRSSVNIRVNQRFGHNTFLLIIIFFAWSVFYFQNNRIHRINEFHGVYQISEALRWVVSPISKEEKYATFTYPGGLEVGPSAVNINSILNAGDKVISFLPGNFIIRKDVQVFSGNGSLTLPSSQSISKTLGEYKNAGQLIDELKGKHFCWAIIFDDYLWLTPVETKIINDLTERSHLNYSNGNVNLYNFCL